MSIIDRISSILAPYDCLGCAAEGGLLCAACVSTLKPAPQVCYQCQLPSLASRTCSSCALPCQPVIVSSAVVYGGLAKDLLWKLKSGGAQQSVKPMVRLMLPCLDTQHPYVIVHIPTATARIRQRGYDQAELLSKELALQAKLPRYNLLARIGQAHQVGADRTARHAQIAGAFRVIKPAVVERTHILLVDDVLTTGATLEFAAKALYQAGAARVDAITFARA